MELNTYELYLLKSILTFHCSTQDLKLFDKDVKSIINKVEVELLLTSPVKKRQAIKQHFKIVEESKLNDK